MYDKDFPLSFGLALAQNEPALEKFKSLTNEQKKAVINKTRKINSKQDMCSFVNCLCDDSLNI